MPKENVIMKRLAIPLLLITAIIWGFAFAAQREISFYMEPFTFGTIRFFLGALSLLPLIFRKPKGETLQPQGKKLNKACYFHGALAGVSLFLAASIQQVGISMTSAGQAGFLSALYVVVVPIMGLLFGRKTNLNTYIALCLSLPALYFLCVKEGGFHIQKGDAFLLGSVGFWALQILLIDRYSRVHEPLALCFAQFLVCAILNLIFALIFETTTWEVVMKLFFHLLYMGVGSTAIAYSLQAIGQQYAKPAHAALIMSTECVFSAIAGAIFFGERMGGRALIGCCLMLLAVILSQLPTKTKR